MQIKTDKLKQMLQKKLKMQNIYFQSKLNTGQASVITFYSKQVIFVQEIYYTC